MAEADGREAGTNHEDRLEGDGGGGVPEGWETAGGVGGGGGGAGGQQDGGREGGDGDGREEEIDGSDAAAEAAPDVVVTANHVGQFKKGKKSMRWKLEMEGGAVEGHGQVFVFDRCEAQLRETE